MSPERVRPSRRGLRNFRPGGTGANLEAYAWFPIATAKRMLQGSTYETKINRLLRLNLWLAVKDKDGVREVFNMGTC